LLAVFRARLTTTVTPAADQARSIAAVAPAVTPRQCP
jgi:hypothetical protein